MVIFRGVVASLLALLPAQASSDRANSPDGRYAVFILPNGPEDEEGADSQVVVIEDTRTHVQRRFLTSKYDGNFHCNLANLSSPLFPLDGGFVYITSTDVTPTSGPCTGSTSRPERSVSSSVDRRAQ